MEISIIIDKKIDLRKKKNEETKISENESYCAKK